MQFSLGQMPQQGPEGEVLAGPVRKMREGRALFHRQGGEWAESPHQLRTLLHFAQAGHLERGQWWTHRQDGSSRGTSWTEYDADGRVVLSESRNHDGLLRSRTAGTWDGEVWVSTHKTYKPDDALARTSVWRYHRDGRPLDTPTLPDGRKLYRYDGEGRVLEVRLERDGVVQERAEHHYEGGIDESVVTGPDGTVLRRGRTVCDEDGRLLERLFTDADGSVRYRWKRTERDAGDPAAITECAVCAGQLAAAMARGFGGVRIVATHAHEHLRDARTGALRPPRDYAMAQVLDAAGRVTIETHHEDWASWHSLRRYDGNGRLQEWWRETTSREEGSALDGHGALTYDEAGRNVEDVLYDPGGLPRQQRTREHDAAGNWVRQVLYKRPAGGTGPLEPVRATYRTISYW